jgi:hypothetical protein
MPSLPSPYAVELQLQRELAEVTDAQERAILAAWALAWSEISGDLFDTLLDLMADGARVTAATVVRSQRLARTLAVVADTLEDLADRAGVTITTDLERVLDQAVDGTGQLIRPQLDDPRRFNPDLLPTRAALTAIVERVTEQITSTLLPIADETYAIIQRELIRGVAVGDSPRDTAARMVERSENLWNFGRARAVNVARTETLDAYRDGAKAAEEPHADILAGWIWLAHLGPKTCRSCLAQHGELHDLDEPGPLDHQQGRCSRCPVVKDEDDGPPDLSWVPSAEEHFESLTKDEQVAILGREGYAAWAAGNFPRSEWAKRRQTDGWRDSFVPASPGDTSGGSGGGPTDGGRGAAGGGNDGEPPAGGGAGDEPVSIRDILNISDNPVLRERADLDTGLIDQVHLIPPRIEQVGVVKMADLFAQMRPGVMGFYVNRDGIGPDVHVRLDTERVDVTMVHELGHMIDDLVFGAGLGDEQMGTENNVDGEFTAWLDTVMASDAARTLQAMLAHSLAPEGNWSRLGMPDGGVGTWDPDPDHVIYLLRPAELFGRAYAQWIATETGNRDLSLQVAREVPRLPEDLTLLAGGIPRYPVHWTPEDFAAIAEAMRALFEARDLLIRRSDG